MTVSDHLNTVQEALENMRITGDNEQVVRIYMALAALDAIEAAYNQRDMALLDLLEISADQGNEVERLRAELAAAQRALNVGTFPLAVRGEGEVVETGDPTRIRRAAEGMCLRCGANEGDWHIAWLGAFNIICTGCFRAILDDRDQASLLSPLAFALAADESHGNLAGRAEEAWYEYQDALRAHRTAARGDETQRGDEPRGWDETTPPCVRCGRIVCMCPTGDETR